MSAAASEGKTVGQTLSWAKNMLDYTDDVCAAVPSEAYAVRPEDPEGHYMFSVGELIMHIADTRWDVIDLTSGSEFAKSRRFLTEYGGIKKPWTFREGMPDEVRQSLQDSSTAVAELLAQPAAALLEPTDSLRQSFEKRLAKMKADGKDTAEYEAGGPSNLADQLLFMVAHEQAHRGTLQHILRARGIPVKRYA